MGGRDEAIGQRWETKDQLDARVRIWKRVLFGVAACLVGAYLVYFGLILGQNPATDADKWGQFGDFVGGLLNPIVAFAAFFWLTESVKLQKQELADTRAELKASALSQAKLADSASISLRISALTAMVNATNIRLEMVNAHINRLQEVIQSPRYKVADDDERRRIQHERRGHISEFHEVQLLRNEYFDELSRILKRTAETPD